MSEIQDDQEISADIQNPLKDVDAPLVDQIPKRLLEKLEELEVGVKVRTMWERGNNDRYLWMERQQEYLKEWDDFLVNSVEGPFSQSSNLHLPVAFTIVKTYHARMMQHWASLEPALKPRRPDSVERAQAVSDVMKYATQCWANRHKGIEEAIDRFLWEWLTTGVGIHKWRWDVQYTRYLDVATVTEAGPPQFTVDEQGNEIAVPTTRQKEVEVQRTKKLYEGPVMDHVFHEDLVIVGGQGDPDLADAVLHRQQLTKSELYTLAYRKIFDLEEVEEVIKSGPSQPVNDAAGNIKDQRAQNAGKTGEDTQNDLDRYEIIEAYLKLDIDNSGIDSDIVAWVHKPTGCILRATYLHRINKAGTRPFVKIDFHKRPGQDNGIGLVEILYPLTKELDMMHNLRVDFGMISTMPFGFYRASSSLDPSVITYEPGQLIPLDNPQTDVFFPQLGNRTSFGMQEEQVIQTYVERLTGISDLSLGVMSGSQGATRTATGARGLISEANANLDVHIRRLARGWKTSHKYLLNMLQQRLPDGMAFLVTGDAGSEYWRYIKDKEDIAGDYDFEFDSNSSQSNPQLKQEKAAQVLQLTSNPLYIQLGAVTASNIFEALKNYLVAMDVKTFSRFITKPPQYSIALSPEEVVNRVARGQSVPVLPTDDNEGILAFYDLILKTDELLGAFTTEQTLTLAKHIQERKQMMAALEQQKAQQANLMQQQINAQNTQFSAPVAQNALQASQGG